MHAKPYSLSVRAVILDDQDRCLVLRRSSRNRNFAGCWEWPGGKLAPGEDFISGLRREVREESGLEIEFTGLAGATEHEMPTVRVVLLCLMARPAGGELRLSHEHDDQGWARLDDLAHWNFLEPLKPILQSLRERKESHG